MTRFVQLGPSVLKHALFLAGLAGFTYGCWLIYRPAGWMIGGLLIAWFALLLDRSGK